MNGRDIFYFLLALAVLWVLRNLFKPDPDVTEAQELPDMWEIQNPNVLIEAMQRGVLQPHQVSEITGNAQRVARIGSDVDKLRNAKGVDDDEMAAVAAITNRGTYPELLLFANMFQSVEGATVGAFLSTLLRTDDGVGNDAPEAAAIVRHIKKLRT